MKNITINDIAKMAGVAKSTVSRYLNGGNVSIDTSKKIKKIIDEYNYEPNLFAQSLKAKKTKLIGVIAPRLDSVVTSRALMALDEDLKSQGYTLLILNTSLDQSLELEYLQMLPRLKVDGIILLATEISKKHQAILQKIKLPTLIVGQKCNELNSIIDDDYAAGQIVGQHILSNGHKNILYIGVSNNDIAVGINRRNGVLDALKQDASIHVDVLTSDFTDKVSKNLTLQYLTDHQPTAIICATDRIAIGAMNAVKQLNLNVGEDISVTGFGGYDHLSVKLTTIRFNSEMTGRLAATTIIDMIEEKDVPQLQITDFKFIEGTTVKNIN